MINKIIEAGYNVDSRDRDGNTIIHLMYYDYLGGRSSDNHILSRLLNCG